MLEYRTWVRGHAQDYILQYFSVLTSQRRDRHRQHLQQIHDHAARIYHAQPHPYELHAADVELKRGIDADWRTSVQKYPEVLEYFYGLVDLNLPDDEDWRVKDPPLSAMGGVGVGRERERKVRIRSVSRTRSRVRVRSRSRVRVREGSRVRDVSRARERERERQEREERERQEREREERRRRERFEGPPMMSGARNDRVRPGPQYERPMGPPGGYGYVQAPGYP